MDTLLIHSEERMSLSIYAIVGHRVRVHLSAECPRTLVSHGTAEFNDGEGIVVGVDIDTPDHPFLVKVFNARLAQHYAACELEGFTPIAQEVLSSHLRTTEQDDSRLKRVERPIAHWRNE